MITNRAISWQAKVRWFCLGLLFTGLTSCKCQVDGNQTKLQYMPDMATSPVARSQREYLDPPEGSISHDAILYPKTAEEAETLLINPFAGRWDEDTQKANGARLFGVYCAVCHGQDLKGHGTVQDKFPPPPDLASDLNKNRKDGFFFHRITYGTAVMPSYGHATSPHERWQIILHVRDLQKASANGSK